MAFRRDGAGFPLDILNRRRPPRDGGTAGPAAGAPGGGGGVPNYVVAPPTVQRPPQATDFFATGTQTARTSANTPSEFPNTTQIPANNVAVIRSVSILANALLVTSDIFWTLRFNGVAVVGWDRIAIAPRAAGSVENSFTPDETFIPVPEGSLVSWDCTVVDGGTYQLSVSTHGWFYSTTIQAQAQYAYGGG